MPLKNAFIFLAPLRNKISSFSLTEKETFVDCLHNIGNRAYLNTRLNVKFDKQVIQVYANLSSIYT